MKKMTKIYVVVPIHNEARHVASVVRDIKKYTPNIVIVNDGSTDNSQKIIEKIRRISVVNLEKNYGKGAAMRVGARFAFKNGATAIIFMDGDRQHSAKHLPKFLARLETGENIIIGIRILKARAPLVRRLGNQFGILLTKYLYGITIPDLLCGYRAFSKKGYKNVLWTANDYGVETEMISIIGRKKLPYTSIVVDTIYLDKYKGFSLGDGMKLLLKLIYWRFRELS